MRDTRMEYGSEFDWDSSRKYVTEEKSGLNIQGARYYRSGRDCLKALADIAGEGYDRVLLPALCCESMVLPFRLKGWTVEFYKMNADFTADKDDILSKLGGRTVLLYMRYFGIRPFEEEFPARLKSDYPELIIAEDRTQDIIIPREEGGFEADVMLASVRKWSALPDGGILVSGLPVPEAANDRRFCDIRRKAMEKKSGYLDGFVPQLKKEFLYELNAASQILDESPVTVGIAEEYRELIEHTDFAAILRKRLENTKLLYDRIKPLQNAGKLRFLTDKPQDSTLYFCILVDNRAYIQKEMAARNVYCPVIWPEPEDVKGVCANARYAVEHMLAIPCDQRYNREDMEYISSCLKEVLSN